MAVGDGCGGELFELVCSLPTLTVDAPWFDEPEPVEPVRTIKTGGYYSGSYPMKADGSRAPLGEPEYQVWEKENAAHIVYLAARAAWRERKFAAQVAAGRVIKEHEFDPSAFWRENRYSVPAGCVLAVYASGDRIVVGVSECGVGGMELLFVRAGEELEDADYLCHGCVGGSGSGSGEFEAGGKGVAV